MVEGEKDEVRIFTHVLNKHGYKVVSELPKLDFTTRGKPLGLELFSNNRADVYILNSKPNRLTEIIKHFNAETDTFSKALGFKHSDTFQGIFLIYDVDHNENNPLQEAFACLNNEEEGLLLIQSPCLEVLGDDENIPIPERKMTHISKDYKTELNLYHERAHHCNTIDYIEKNFEKLALRFLILSKRLQKRQRHGASWPRNRQNQRGEHQDKRGREESLHL